jgi:hypothetical protein
VNQFEMFFVVLVLLLMVFFDLCNVVIDFLLFEFDKFPISLSFSLIYLFFILEELLLILRHLDGVFDILFLI